jgi:hypothetical protein
MIEFPVAVPDTCAVTFKEWSGVCDALAEGRQSIILRKGGIAEEAGRFVPEHCVFWLYPTHVHEAQQGLRTTMAALATRRAEEESGAATLPISVLAEVVTIGHIDRLEPLERLAGLHVWTDDTVRARFRYREPGLWVLGVRVHRREQPWLIEVTPAYAGCKTWVTLDEPLATSGLAPVLDEAELARRLDLLCNTIPCDRVSGTVKGARCNG